MKLRINEDNNKIESFITANINTIKNIANKCGYYVYSNYGKNVKNEFCLECSPQPRNNEDIDKFERLISKLLRNSNINYYIQETTKKPLGTIYLCLY
jgi:hypothetical protein